MLRLSTAGALAFAACTGPGAAPTAELRSPDARHVARVYRVALPEAVVYRVAVAPAREPFRPGGVGGPGPRDVLEARGTPGPALAWVAPGTLVVRVPAAGTFREVRPAVAGVQVRAVYSGGAPGAPPAGPAPGRPRRGGA